MSFFIVSNLWNVGHHCPNGSKQTLWIYWPALKGAPPLPPVAILTLRGGATRDPPLVVDVMVAKPL